MTSPLYLTVDLGGTSLRIALLDSQGTILNVRSFSSDSVQQGDKLIDLIRSESHKFHRETKEGEIVGLSLGIPGIVDSKNGVVYQSPHFPEWKEIYLQKELSASLPFPVYMDNDANQAALGEGWKGAGKNWDDFVMLTLGTGVGGGIVLNRKIFHGPSGFAGEVGHIVLDRDGLPGALGSEGTLETWASQSGLRLQLKNILENSDFSLLSKEMRALDPNDSCLPEKLVKLATHEDPQALSIWRHFGETLACGIASIANVLGVFRFVIGGGLAGAWKFFYEPCRREIPRRMYKTTAAMVEVVQAELGNQAGLMGGVRIIQESTNKSNEGSSFGSQRYLSKS